MNTYLVFPGTPPPDGAVVCAAPVLVYADTAAKAATRFYGQCVVLACEAFPKPAEPKS